MTSHILQTRKLRHKEVVYLVQSPGTWLALSICCCDHGNDSRSIVLKRVSSLAELSLLGGPELRREFQELESDILQQASSTMYAHLFVITS